MVLKLQLSAVHVCMGTVLLLENVSVMRDGKEIHVNIVSCTNLMYDLVIKFLILFSCQPFVLKDAVTVVAV